MSDETVLITGIQGFVGGALALRLLAKGYRVRGLTRRDADLPGVEVLRGAIADRDATAKAADGVASVVHCVAYFGTDMTEAVRVVWDLADRGLGTVVVRSPNVLGPSELNSWSYHIALRIQEGGLAIGGDGGNSWPYVVLENLIDAIVLGLRSPQAVGETYTVVDGHTTGGGYAGMFASWLGATLERREAREPYDTFYGRFSTGKARRELGWAPRVTFDEVMEQTRAFLQTKGVVTTG